jgi:hypothetical protein
MCVACANTNALEPLRKLIALTSRCEDQLKFFESKYSNQKGFVSYAGLMLRLSSTYVSTLFIIKLKHPPRARSVECVKFTVFNFFDNDPIKSIFGDKLRRYASSKVATVPLRKLSAVFRHSVFSCLFQKTCLVRMALIGSSTTYTRYVKKVKFTTMGSSGKDIKILCFWPFTPCRSIFAQNLRDESWSHMCV